MSDIECIKYIEEKLGIKLNRVSLDKLFTEKYFLTQFGFSLSEIQAPGFPFKGVRNYSVDAEGNVTGLALDFCDLFVLEDNFPGKFKYLQKLKLKNSYLEDYSFLHELKELCELDLSFNQLTNADFLKELKNLTTLDLRSNQLMNADFLKELKNLTTLDLRSNQLMNADFLKELKNLTTLDLSGNQLMNADFLKELKNLTTLYLSGNQLTNADFLKELKNLTTLYLRDNQLTNADFLKELKNLTTLDLSFNQLMNADFLKELKNLTTLDLSGNRLTNADFLKELKNLTTLDLRGNQLTNADFLKELKNLTTLYLRDNQLTNADFLKELKNLTTLDLSFNQLMNADFLKELKNLTTLDLRDNRLTNADFLKELKNLTTLDLSGNQLTNADFLKELKNLTTLDLSGNQLTNADFLKELKNLTTLDLRGNQLTNADFLKELKNLTTLDLSGNQLTNADFLKELKNLTTLDLSGNQLTNADFLKELKDLTTLDLSDNQLTNYDFLKELKNLTTLDLSGNQLTNADFLKELKNLTTLYLRDNQLMNADFLKELKDLTTLDLSDNQLTNADFLKELKNLTTLYLSGNQLTNADFLKELKNLTTLDLSFNQLMNADFLKELKNLISLYLYGNPSLNLPKNLRKMIEDKGQFSSLNRDEIKQIIRYYEQLEEGKDYIFEAKVLVVGEPQAGKTTLTQKTKDNEKWLREMKGKRTESTVGINIDILSFPYQKDKSKEIKAHFWDFGGHTAQYVLHQYFFTENSLYVLLADGRKEFPNFNYWFEIIATLGKGSPVLVVLNENECKPIQTFNINEYRKEFGSALDSIEERPVNFYDDADGRFDTLKLDIQNKVCSLKHIGNALPAKWVKIRKEIEELGIDNAYIERDKYIEICDSHKLTNKDDQQDVLDNLHILGIALNYKSDINLRNKLILKPNWVIDALYVVLKDTEIARNKGEFEVDYVDRLWEKEGYSSKDCDILLSLMQKDSFEIAYRLGGSNKFIVPILLPYKPVDYQLEEVNPLQMRIEYAFMPKGIISRLIVRLHKNIVNKNEQIVWNKGVLLIHHNSIAEVIESEQSRQISIKVTGENKYHNKELLTIIRNEIISIHRDWFSNRLIFEELVPCVCDKCKDLRVKYENFTEDEIKNLNDDERKRLKPEPYKLFELQDRLTNGRQTIECRKSYQPIDIGDLLQDIYILEKDENRGMNNINISNLDGNNISVIVNNDIQNSTVRNLVKHQSDSDIVNGKLDEMFTKLSEAQSQEMQALVNQLTGLVEEKLVKGNKLNAEQTKAFEEIKITSDWKAKLKIGIPFNWFISQLTGASVEFEKEWKVGKEIKPDNVISLLRKVIPNHELQKTGFNELEAGNNERKALTE